MSKIPSGSFLPKATNRTLGASSKIAIPVKTGDPKVTKKEKEDNEYFHLNALLVSSLLPLIPADEREAVQKWMNKFYTMGASAAERSTRNDYIWFLLVQLESGAVTLPFVRDPPAGIVGPVTKSIEKKLYEEILEAANNRAAFVDDLNLPPRDETTIGAGAENIQYCRPSEFHDNQPKPKMGFIAYGSCFSDQYT